MHQDILNYIHANENRFLEELFELLRIPSVSADSRHQADVLNAAHFLVKKMQDLDFNSVELLETGGFPIVFAEKIINPNLPTIMVYGHYDVQPPDPLDLWLSPPFEPEIRDGKIYARGACDDKGQMYMHIKAYEILKNTTGLPCNVKFFIEGEEEVGSANIESALIKYKDKLKCDVLLISDTSMLSMEHPSLSVSLRGLSYLEVEVVGPNRDLHSGVYGGAVDNPINTLCEMITKLKDENLHITIPGFYDDVIELTEEERSAMAALPFDREEYLKHLDIADTRGEKGYSIVEQATIRPTLDVNGIWGGYIGEGAKTVLPSRAYAKISMRLVPNQDNAKITQLFSEYFASLAPPSVKVTVKPHHGGNPFLTDTTSQGYLAASQAITTAFDKAPVATREGGSIPIMALFKQILQTDIVLMGFGLDTDAIHSPNEHYGVFNFKKGIETIALFHHYYTKLMTK